MALQPDDRSLALFCDFENIALGVRDAKYRKFNIQHVLERLLVKGSIVVKKAYCDWDRYKEFKGPMHEAAFELIEIPHVRMSGKNSADIRMVVDALDLCYTKQHVDTFVVISGDSDFSPLVSKLRENAKTVIGVGVKNSTSDLLISNCDEFIYYDDLVRELERQRTPPRADGGPGRSRGGRKRSGRSGRGRGAGHDTAGDAQPELPADARNGSPSAVQGEPASDSQVESRGDSKGEPKGRGRPHRGGRGSRDGARSDAAPDERADERADAAGADAVAAPEDVADAAASPKAARAAAGSSTRPRSPFSHAHDVGVGDDPFEDDDDFDLAVADEGDEPDDGDDAEDDADDDTGAHAVGGDDEGSDEATDEATDEERQQEGIDLVYRTAAALSNERGGKDKLWGSMIKQTLKRRRPGFNESYYGFDSFSKMLEEAEAQGLFALEADERSGGYVIRDVAA